MASSSGRLYEAVLADPGNRELIRVYGDALLAQGDPQGEAIQLACAFEDLSRADPARARLERRLDELVHANRYVWTRAVWPRIEAANVARNIAIDFVRGLPAHLGAITPTLVRILPAVAEVVPIVSVRARGPRIGLDELEALAVWPRIRRLELTGRGTQDDGPAARLLGSPRLPALERLVAEDLSAATVAALGTASALASLRELVLDCRDGATIRDLLPLLARAGERLVELRLRRVAVGADGVAAIAERCPHLRVLYLERCAIDAKAAQRLAGEPAFAGVEELGLGGNTPGKQGCAALAGSAVLQQVTRMSLARRDGQDPPIKTDHLQAFAEAVAWPKLRALDLSLCNLGARGVPLLEARGLRRIGVLGLAGNQLKDAGAGALAKLELDALRVLDLSGNTLRAAGMRALASAPWLARLEDLALRHNNFKSAGGEALGAGSLAALRVLRLGHNWLGANGLTAILKVAPSLTRIDAGANNYDSRVLLKALLSDRAPPLCELEVYEVSARQLEQLAASRNATTLRTLALRSDHLDDARAERLAASPHLAELGHLRLSSGALGERGRAALAQRFGPRLELV